MDLPDNLLWTPERQAIRFLSDASPQMVRLTDENSCTIYVNTTWSHFTGQSYDQALGQGWLDIIHPDDLEAAFTSVSRAHDDRLPHHTNYRIRSLEGRYAETLATTHPLSDKAGNYIGYVGSNSTPVQWALRRKPEDQKPRSFILSNRERTVLTWVAAGLTAEEIGERLHIAPRTVEYHIHSSARKLNSSNRVQTVAKAAVFGEIDLHLAIGL